MLDKNGMKVPVSGQDASPVGLQNVLLGKQSGTVYKPFQLEAKASVGPRHGAAEGPEADRADDGRDGTPFLPRRRSSSTPKNMQVVFDDGNAKVADICTGEVAGSLHEVRHQVAPSDSRWMPAPDVLAVVMRTGSAHDRSHTALAGSERKEEDDDSPDHRTAGHPQELRPRRRAQGREHEGPPGQGQRARRRQRRRQVHPDQGPRGRPALRRRARSRSTASRSPSTPRSDASGLGIEVVYQDLALCENLDIVQNMFLGREETTNGMLDERGDGEARVRDAAGRSRCAP